MVPDYTDAFLASLLVLVLLTLVAISALWGFPAACLSGLAADRALARRAAGRDPT